MVKIKDLYDDSIRPIAPDELATKARTTLKSRKIRVLPVANSKGRLLGVVYRSSVIGLGGSGSVLLVRDVMSEPKVITNPNEEAEKVTKAMLNVDEWYAVVVKSPTDRTYLGLFGLEHMILDFLRRGGPKLSVKVEEIMTREVVSARYDEPISAIWHKMIEKAYSGIPVIDEKGKVLGIVTQLDLLLSRAPALNIFLKNISPSYAPEVSKIMNKNVVVAKPYTTVGEAAYAMLKLEIGRLPIVNDEGKLVGMVDREDIVRHFLGLKR